MGTSNSHLSFDDVRTALDRALASEKGIRIYESTFGRLINLRQRIHKLKSIERKRSKFDYDPKDQRYGTCVYDVISVLTNDKIVKLRKNDDGTWPVPDKSELFIDLIKRTPASLEMEDL